MRPLTDRDGPLMTDNGSGEDILTDDDVRQILAVSGPITLRRNRLDRSCYDEVTLIGSGMTIKQHRGYFYAYGAGRTVVAMESSINELLARLRGFGGI